MAAAFVAVNAMGHVRDRDGRIIAGARNEDGSLVDTELRLAVGPSLGNSAANTTISVIALNVALTKVELHQVARSASGACHRRIGPAGTSYDGDIIFVVCPLSGPRASLMRAEVTATAALEDGILRAVRLAKGRDGIPGLAD